MMRSMFSGVAGMRNFQYAIDVVGNNIANVNTVGFKGSRVTFQTALLQTMKAARVHKTTLAAQTQYKSVSVHSSRLLIK